MLICKYCFTNYARKCECKRKTKIPFCEKALTKYYYSAIIAFAIVKISILKSE